MKRREFIKASCALCGLGAIGTTMLTEGCKKNDTTPQGPTVNFTIDISQSAYSGLTYSGGSIASNGVVIVNLSGSYIAVAEQCTHKKCNVSYDNSANNFVCPCHNGVFGTNGNVISGPPKTPLKTYTVTKNGAVLTVAG